MDLRKPDPTGTEASAAKPTCQNYPTNYSRSQTGSEQSNRQRLTLRDRATFVRMSTYSSLSDSTRGRAGRARGTRIEVRGYLFLNELQPGSIKRDTQTPTRVHQTPPFLGEKHHERERHRVRPAAQNQTVSLFSVYLVFKKLKVKKIKN